MDFGAFRDWDPDPVGRNDTVRDMLGKLDQGAFRELLSEPQMDDDSPELDDGFDNEY